MLHPLPITNVRLLACPEDWHRMTPTDQGRHCQRCDREVVDFTGADAAELAAARSAAPGGRVCGRFRPSQLASKRPVRFGLWARAFALALALVFGQGLTAREAWAQTRKATTTKANAPVRRPVARPTPAAAAKPVAAEFTEGSVAQEYVLEPPPVMGLAPFDYERPPEPPGGMETLQQYLRKHLQYPEKARHNRVEGLVFVNFVVAPDGQLTNVNVTRGIGFGCDEEAMRVVSQLPRWEPARRNGRPVAVSYTLPVRFKLTEPE